MSTNGTHEAARLDYLASGGTLTGKQLAERHGKSERWGRQQVAAARNGNGRKVPTNGTAPTNGSRPAVVKPAAQPAQRRAATRTGAAPAVRRVTAAAVALVAVVAAAASYNHMRTLALEAGEGHMSVVLPLSVDGLVLAASMSLLAAKRAGRAAGVLPWLALLLGLGASLAANVAAADPTVAGRLVAAWPPVALVLSFELLLRQTRGER